MADVKIYQETEGCTYENLKGILGRIEDLGFDKIVVHKKVKELIPNSIYTIVEINGAEFPNNEAIKHQIKIPLLLDYVQCEFYLPANGTKGVLEFESPNGEIVGYYNKTDNILIISDVLHPGGIKAVAALALFIETVENFKKTKAGEFSKWAEERGSEIQYPKFLMGADPEFELLDADSNVIAACTVWPDGGKGSGKHLGCDGEAMIGEIRPDPKACPLELTREIKKLLERVKDDPGFEKDGQMWVGGGVHFRIGGHIHVSGIDPDEDLLHYLGVYIAEPMKRSMNLGAKYKGDGEERKEHYLGNWKPDNNDRIRGSDERDPNHWEWRPLMAYHFDEATANAVHCVFFCVAETYRRNRKALKKTGVSAASYKKLEFYDQYSAHVDSFIEKFVNGVQAMEGIDVLDRWFPNRGKDRRLSFMSLSRPVPKGISEILDGLRGKEFPDLRKSMRCNVQSYEGGSIIYAGICNEAVKLIEATLKGKMIGWDFSAEMLSSLTRGYKKWDFVFAFPKNAYKFKEDRNLLVNMVFEAITMTLKGGG